MVNDGVAFATCLIIAEFFLQARRSQCGICKLEACGPFPEPGRLGYRYDDEDIVAPEQMSNAKIPKIVNN